MKPLLPVKLPDVGRPVRAVVMCPQATLVWANMVATDEDDNDWRFCEDNAELSFTADVIYWEYLKEDGG